MLSFSQRQQPGQPGGRGAPTDGREYDVGRRFHAEAKPGCGDDKNCLFRKCSELCSNYTRTPLDGGKHLGPVTLNQIDFNCTGTCYDPRAAPR